MLEATILHETDHWLVIDKPAGLIVHPATTHYSLLTTHYSSVVDWLLSKYPTIADLDWPDNDRPGIVHRLDTDTSGVLLLAKDPETLAQLQQQFVERTVQKTYWGLVLGEAPESQTLTGSISRKSGGVEQQVRRLSFSWERRPMKPAETELRTIGRFREHLAAPLRSQGRRVGGDQPFTSEESPNGDLNQFTLVELLPKTGRTHQLRVQLLDAGLPLVGDQQYSTKASRGVSAQLDLTRQFLHAVKLEFDDPASGERVTVESPLPRDLQLILSKLRPFGPDPSLLRLTATGGQARTSTGGVYPAKL